MNVGPCFLPAGLSIKRWPMVFVLAMAAIYGVIPRRRTGRFYYAVHRSGI
jgi:hypothetical protein